MKTGQVAEVIFDLLAVRRGWLSARPVQDGAANVDRIINRDGHLESVQIKSCRTGASRSINRKKGRGYSADAFDVLAMVDVDSGDVWLVPWCDFLAVTRRFRAAEWEAYRANAFTGGGA